MAYSVNITYLIITLVLISNLVNWRLQIIIILFLYLHFSMHVILHVSRFFYYFLAVCLFMRPTYPFRDNQILENEKKRKENVMFIFLAC